MAKGNSSRNKKIIIGTSIIIVLLLLFTLTPLKNVFFSGKNDKVSILIKQAKEYFDEGEINRALDKLDLAEQSNPTADQLEEIKKLRKKFLKAKRGELGSENEVQRLIRHARYAANDGNYDTAIFLLKKAKKINNSKPNPDQEANEEIDRLIKQYTKLRQQQALRDNPNELLRRARNAAARGDFENALRLVRRSRRAYDAQNMRNRRLNRRIRLSNRIYRQRQRRQAANDDPEELINQARREAANRNYDNALLLLRRARRANNARRNPSADLENRIRRLEREYSDRQRREAHFSSPEELVRQAENAADNEDYITAIRLLKKARRANNSRSNPDEELNKKIDRLQKLYEQKLRQQALNDDPRDMIRRARRAAQNGDYGTALRFLDRANRANSARRKPNRRIERQINKLRKIYQQRQAQQALNDNPEAMVREAQRVAGNENYDRALDLLSRARRANNMRTTPSRDLNNRITRLENEYRKKLREQAQNDNPEQLIAKARKLAKRGDYEGAIYLLKRARRANNLRRPPNKRTEKTIARLIAEYTRAMQRQARRDNPRKLLARARKEMEQGNYDNALRLVRRARRANNARRKPSKKLAKEIDKLEREILKRLHGNNNRGSSDNADTGNNRGSGISRAELNRILEQERERQRRLNQNQNQNRQNANNQRQNKNKIKKLLAQARQALNRGDNDRAIALYRKVLEIDPNNAEANSYISTAYLRKNKLPQALKFATRAISINPDNANAYVTRGEVFFRNRQDDQAEVEFRNAIRLDKNQALAYYRLGVINLIKRRNSTARGYFIKATRVPSFRQLSTNLKGKCYYNFGKSNERLRRYSSALKAYGKSLVYDTNNYKSYISMGQIYYLQKKYNTGAVYFKKANNIKDTYYAHFWLGKCYDAMRNFAVAIKEYRKALQLKPGNYEAMFNLGRSYALMGKHQTAIEHYNNAGNKHGFKPKLLVQIGNSYLALKNYSNASKNYKKALEANSREVEAYKGLGRTLQEQGNIPGAIVYLKEGANLTKAPSLYAKLGELYFKIRDYDQAISAFRSALERATRNVKYRRLIADVYFTKKDFKNAANEYEKVIALNPREWIAYHRLGDAYIELRMLEAAKVIYKKLINRNPGYRKIDLIRQKLNSLQGGS